jgi:hypothetical protein
MTDHIETTPASDQRPAGRRPVGGVAGALAALAGAVVGPVGFRNKALPRFPTSMLVSRWSECARLNPQTRPPSRRRLPAVELEPRRPWAAPAEPRNRRAPVA